MLCSPSSPTLGVTAGMKVAGMLPFVALAIIPAAAARSNSPAPELMSLAASLIGIASRTHGL